VNVTTVPTPTITLNNGVLTSSAAVGNQWYLNGTLIPNATGKTYLPLVNGDYMVQITVNGCTSDVSAVYKYAFTFTADQPVILGPNPVQTVLTLRWDAATWQMLSVEITDMYGMPVLFKESISSGTSINIAGLQTGTYYVKMYGADKKPVSVLKILKVN
jgi:hypothetical protein